mmetsp:Transcript_70603/g.103480  ORF Transcript_70603/g.103480 Transcript_70603/m.103480 type:complete len:167 (-) Transcript_70603:211-711(-)
MFQLRSPGLCCPEVLPRWLDPFNEEKLLDKNGWSFLHPDEQEPHSPFDIEAAAHESQYVPEWAAGIGGQERVSKLAFNVTCWSEQQVLEAARYLPEVSQNVLLRGATETAGRKLTACGFKVEYHHFSSGAQEGVFCCALGGLPLFASDQLHHDTASSGMRLRVLCI